MADYSTSTPLTTNTGLVYGLVGVSNTNNPILYDPNSIGSRTLTFTAPTGFSVVGSPLTGTGTISLGFSAGYSLPTTASQTNWDTAFGWGNHAAVGYLTSFTETDPVFSAAPASGIVAGDITNWNSAYGWGDHAAVGYLASGDIGSTVLAYDANLQGFATALTLPTVDGTAGQTLKTDGAGTVSFADVVTNGQIINGTAFFVTDTKPTTRIGGGALVAGDKWYKTDDGTEWFWNGTYWLSQEVQISTASVIASGSSSVGVYFPSSTYGDRPVWIETLIRAYWVQTADASNYWRSTGLTYRFFNAGTGLINGGGNIFNSTIDTLTTGQWVETKEAVNVVYLPGAIPESMFFGFTKIGTPSAISAYGVLYFRKVFE